MKRIIGILGILAVLALPALAATKGGTADIKKAETYLQNLDKLKANFTQTYMEEDGQQRILTGTFFLDRPGRMRFEFNEINDFIVADGLFVYFYDSEEQQQSNAPIGQTLADFLLRKDIELEGKEVTVTDIRKSNGYTYITVTQKSDPDVGRLTMTFSQIPFSLKKWSVIDAVGTQVDVALNNIQEVSDFERSGLFMYHDPLDKPGQLND